MNMTAIAIVGIIAWAIVSITDSLRSKNVKKASRDVSQLESEVAQLKERIEVLEKIVTDSNYDLKKQFDDLEKDKVA
ncbi:hypothetical protein OPS25_03455 [Alteromonas ponticola]|uniref:Uncharacterized protein n=2 Tax=Alteromonas aquimaris TaxID=2998417 RepID=A0ABT3P485_9ALTE|nr:hypothetical protein [Alteromonas aquimaris]MCW8107561.1 hypothetical protein [Alteromonas aquimaris]